MNAVESTPPFALWCTRRRWETSQAAGRAREVTKGRPTVLPRAGRVARSITSGAWRGQPPAAFARTRAWCSSTAACADRVSNPVYPGWNSIYPGSRCSSTLASADRYPKGCSCAPSRRQGVSPRLLETTARPLAWAGWTCVRSCCHRGGRRRSTGRSRCDKIRFFGSYLRKEPHTLTCMYGARLTAARCGWAHAGRLNLKTTPFDGRSDQRRQH